METKTAYLGLGSNLGNRIKNLGIAIEEISQIAEVSKKSSIYETQPVGLKDQPDFLNMAIEIKTDKSPKELLIKLLEIEHKMGRVREIENGPRKIDIDILLYGDQVINEKNIQIPHPKMHEREFVLEPLEEIAPTIKHPIMKMTIKQLLNEL